MTDRKYATGAEVRADGVSFRVWAPSRKRVTLSLPELGDRIPLDDEGGGYFSVFVRGLHAGTLYSYRLDDVEYDYPDPSSRFQPRGVHGPSQVVASDFSWKDDGWKGLDLPGQVLYELHIGCFTPEGTWRAAAEKLPLLREVGVTAVEVMPVAEFPGEFGWGYDGVFWYAPTRLYGSPDEFRAFVDAAHALGLGVLLDAVYNHFGPAGNYTGSFAKEFVSDRHRTEWGDAINYDGPQAAAVREFAVANAAYWIEEFHLDGLRLDATQAIFDDSPRHLLADLSTAARKAAGDRSILIFAENHAQDVKHVAPVEEGGFGLDGMWNDDFHHACRVASTGHAEFYYADYAGTASEILAATKWGFLYQGQHVPRMKHRRGTPALDTPAARLVNFLMNHDQIANSAHGDRISRVMSPGNWRALTTLLLLAPGTPMLFMGQEFGASTPFLYFADHEVDLAALVREGRWEYLRMFPRVAGGIAAAQFSLADPSDRSSFRASRIDWSERERNRQALALHRDLLRLRREDVTIRRQDKTRLHGTVISDDRFLLRWLDPSGEDRLLLVNLTRDYAWRPAAEPLLAPPRDRRWELLFSSDDARYGGSGSALLDAFDWALPGHAAILLQAVVESAE